MFKKLTLLILVVISLDIYSQVVIKDEILLDNTIPDKDGTEAAGLTMPFYGKVREEVYWYSIACGNGRTDLIVDGSYYPFGQCYYMNCGSENCFCQTGYHYKEIPNVPMGTSVDTRFQRCWIWGGPGHPPSWGELEHYFQLISATETQWKYEAKARMTINHPWQHASYVYLTKTTPPGCSYADICTPGFTILMPDTLTVKQPFSFTNEDECSTYTNILGEPVIPLAAFSGVKEARKSSNIFDLTPEDDIEACFDLQTQKWKFNLLIENATLNYVKDICLDNIQNPPVGATPIYDLSAICNLPPTECSTLKRSLKAHKSYPFTSDLYDGYVFTEILLTHETEHQRDWEGYIKKYVNGYYNIPEKINYYCEDFTSNQEAREKILIDVKNLFASEFWNPYKKDWMINEFLWPNDLATAKKKREKEKDLHKRESIKLVIQKYEDEINKLCNGNCP